MRDDAQLYIDFDPHEGGLLIALCFIPLAERSWAGVILLNNGEQKSFFKLTLDEADEPVDFLATADLNPWDGFAVNLLNIQRDFDQALPLGDELAEELELLHQEFLAEWFFAAEDGAGAFEAQYEALGMQLFPLNVRPAQLAEMEYCEAEDDPSVTWFEFNTVEDGVVRQMLEEYI